MPVQAYSLDDLRGSPKALSARAKAEIETRLPQISMTDIERIAANYSMIDQTFRAGGTLGQVKSSLKKLQQKLEEARRLFDDLEPFAQRQILIGTDFPGSAFNAPPRKLLDDLIRAISFAHEEVPLGRRRGPRDWLARELIWLFEEEDIEISARPGGILSRVMAIILQDMDGNTNELRKVIKRALADRTAGDESSVCDTALDLTDPEVWRALLGEVLSASKMVTVVRARTRRS